MSVLVRSLALKGPTVLGRVPSSAWVRVLTTAPIPTRRTRTVWALGILTDIVMVILTDIVTDTLTDIPSDTLTDIPSDTAAAISVITDRGLGSASGSVAAHAVRT